MLPIRNNGLTLIVHKNSSWNIVKKRNYLFAGM